MLATHGAKVTRKTAKNREQGKNNPLGLQWRADSSTVVD